MFLLHNYTKVPTIYKTEFSFEQLTTKRGHPKHFTRVLIPSLQLAVICLLELGSNRQRDGYFHQGHHPPHPSSSPRQLRDPQASSGPRGLAAHAARCPVRLRRMCRGDKGRLPATFTLANQRLPCTHFTLAHLPVLYWPNSDSLQPQLWIGQAVLCWAWVQVGLHGGFLVLISNCSFWIGQYCLLTWS